MVALLGFKGIFDIKPGMDISREKWEKYPIYLKHTVFHSGSDIEKVRNMEMGHIFFVQDHLRERGNKRFIRGHYEKALCHYEKVIFCSKFLIFVKMSAKKLIRLCQQ